MKKSLTFLTTCLMLAFSLQAFAQREERKIGSFDKLEVSGAIELQLRQADQTSLYLEGGDAEARERIETFVDGNTLIIRHKKDKSFWKNRNEEEVTVFLSVARLNAIEVSGASEVESEGTFRAERMDIEVSGAGELDLAVEVDELTIDCGGASELNLQAQANTIKASVSGASDIKLSGQANELKADASGASEIEARELAVKRGKVSASGAGSCSVSVSEALEAEASGGSSVRYAGNPEKVNVSSSGGSTIKKASL